MAAGSLRWQEQSCRILDDGDDGGRGASRRSKTHVVATDKDAELLQDGEARESEREERGCKGKADTAEEDDSEATMLACGTSRQVLSERTEERGRRARRRQQAKLCKLKLVDSVGGPPQCCMSDSQKPCARKDCHRDNGWQTRREQHRGGQAY